MRRRYHDFIPENYSAGFFKLNSDTNKRNIESMQKYLQGLYPSITESQYDINIDSSILKAFISPTFILQYLKLTVTSAKFRSFMKEHKKLFKYLLEYGKLDVPIPERLAHSYVVYDVLTTEKRNNLTLPEWTKSVFPENVTELARAFGKTMGYNRKMQKASVGPFLNVLVDHFDKISNQSTEERILLFSGHDINLMCLLNTFDVFDQFEYDVPAFANSIIFEMREKDGKHFINGYYRILDHPDLYPITFKGCAFDCDYREFKERLAVVRMNYKLLNRYNLDVTTETFSKTSLYQSLERLF
ncbi:unnamed protein product [Acanthoscelides obtectus]|nr:unnamed protein product [Acanthoscelides obtectus]CAK1622992.1 hypothetical protein AOBTE_LOCUS1762 [Acanthoscelides obtectus]